MLTIYHLHVVTLLVQYFPLSPISRRTIRYNTQLYIKLYFHLYQIVSILRLTLVKESSIYYIYLRIVLESCTTIQTKRKINMKFTLTQMGKNYCLLFLNRSQCKPDLHHNYQRQSNQSPHLVVVYHLYCKQKQQNEFESITKYILRKKYHHNDDIKPKSDTSFLSACAFTILVQIVKQRKEKGKHSATILDIPKYSISC